MSYGIIILDQIGNQLHLYANCFKDGYTRLCYFSDSSDVREITLSRPEVTLQNLSEDIYYLWCENNNGDGTGHMSVEISGISRANLFDNILAAAGLVDDVYKQIASKITSYDYVTELYNKYLTAEDKKEEYEKLIIASIDYYNLSQEELNHTTQPEFSFDNNTIYSTLDINFKFVPYIYNGQNYELVKDCIENNTNSYTFYGKPSEMRLILVLSDSNVVRKYYVYEPSETLSKTKYESAISAVKFRNQKIIELISQMELSDILDDEYGQEVVAALQEVTPEHSILHAPTVTYDEDKRKFDVSIDNYTIIEVSGQKIFLCALEIDQAFANNKAPHRILVTSSEFRFSPLKQGMNFEEDYIFYLSNEAGKILSIPTIEQYNTSNDIETYYKISRKIDLEKYRRRLFNIFKQYDKSDWDTISLILDSYLISNINIHKPITEYMIQKITYLDPTKYKLELLIQLVLLNRLKYYAPIDQDFIHTQVYAEGYFKHVMPEYEWPYLIQITRINNNTISYDYIQGGDSAKEIRIDKDDFIYINAISEDLLYMSPYAMYYNIYLGKTRYLFFPQLEVDVRYGLY